MKWVFKRFEELTLDELYKAIKLREEVFVVEQKTFYLDCDGKDFNGWHIFGWDESDSRTSPELACYMRILPPGARFEEMCLSRVVVSPNHRRTGLGRELMDRGLKFVRDNFGNAPLRISAQRYLEKFYSGFGFVTVSEPYLEDAIEHVEMFLQNKSSL